eukprot:jgi/Galph1/5493/GphlegSOOS_G4162.1
MKHMSQVAITICLLWLLSVVVISGKSTLTGYASSLVTPKEKALVKKQTFTKPLALSKNEALLFLELLDGSVELVDAIQGTILWSLQSEKLAVLNQEQLDADCLFLGPDYRLYLLKKDGIEPYYLGRTDSLLALYHMDTSALFVELDTGEILRQIDCYSEQEPFEIPCLEETSNETSCVSILKEYETKRVGLVFRKFVGIRFYDAVSGKSHFANFSRFEPSSFLLTGSGSQAEGKVIASAMLQSPWYGELFMASQHVGVRDWSGNIIWTKSYSMPVTNVIALGDMSSKESRTANHDEWLPLSSLKMIGDMPYHSLETLQNEENASAFISIPNEYWFPKDKWTTPSSSLRRMVFFLCLFIFCFILWRIFIPSIWYSMKKKFLNLVWKRMFKGKERMDKYEQDIIQWKKEHKKQSIHEKLNGKLFIGKYTLTVSILMMSPIKTYYLSYSIKEDEWRVGKLIVSNKVLGLGSHGTVVFEGRLDKDGRRVAIKRLLRTFYDLAKKEIEMLIALDEMSPYIVRYYAMEEDDDFVYLALELCSNTLEEQVQSWKENVCNDTCQSILILRQVMCGLADLHRYGVVHRDLKPQNILLNQCKEQLNENHSLVTKSLLRVKIADVGLAKKLDPTHLSVLSSHNKEAEGSCGWRAAEVLNKEKRQNMAMDIFAAGCIIYYVLSQGKHPFGESIYERDGRICKGEYDILELERLNFWEAKHLIEKMIALSPEERPSARQVLRHPLFWSDSKKLNFLVDVSDRLSFLKSKSWQREARELVSLFEKTCQVCIENEEMTSLSWASKMDISVLKALNGRHYDRTCVSDLLRLIRNKRSHYNELPQEVQQLLGVLPSSSSDPYQNRHNFWCYFQSRFPKLLITVYSFVTKRHEFYNDFHFQRYGLEPMEPSFEGVRSSSVLVQHSKVISTPSKERKRYSIEFLLERKTQIPFSKYRNLTIFQSF